MPKVGDKEFDYTPEGVTEAEQYSADTGIPMSNAMDRTVTEYAGGGKVGYDSIGKYKKGGKVKKGKAGLPVASAGKTYGPWYKDSSKRYRMVNGKEYKGKMVETSRYNLKLSDGEMINIRHFSEKREKRITSKGTKYKDGKVVKKK